MKILPRSLAIAALTAGGLQAPVSCTTPSPPTVVLDVEDAPARLAQVVPSPTPARQAESTAPAENFIHPPIGVIKSQDYEVVLHTGPDGPLYSIRNPDGSVVATEISRQQLAADFPELNEDLNGLWAGNEAGHSTISDLPMENRPGLTSRLR